MHSGPQGFHRMTVSETMALPEPEAISQRRYKCFDDTHQEMIEAAVRLISEKGLDSLSISAVARALGIEVAVEASRFAESGLIGAILSKGIIEK